MTYITEILKNAPEKLELYSPLFGNVKLLDVIGKLTPIHIKDCENEIKTFTSDGKFYTRYKDAECMLFPSKEHKSWNNWQEVLFQRGDVIVSQNETPVGFQTFLCYENDNRGYLAYGVGGGKNYITPTYYRYATPEEREQFFKELNINGYKWNADTKQIEKIEQQYTPKYKVGYWIKFNDSLCEITNIEDYRYELFYYSTKDKVKIFINEVDTNAITATEQELIDAGIKEKSFTIDDFKPFDKVLVQDLSSHWTCDFYIRYDNTHKLYACITSTWDKCIPYNDETKHLLGTTDDCPDKYKTW